MRQGLIRATATLPWLAGCSLILLTHPGNRLWAQPRTAGVLVEAQTITSARTLNLTLPDGYVLSGVVRDAGGAPIPFARVAASDSNGILRASTVSAADGAYAMAVIAGSYDLAATLSGDAATPPAAIARSTTGRLTEVSISSDLGNKNITLPDGYILSGTLKSAGGAMSHLYGSLLCISTVGGKPLAALRSFGFADKSQFRYAIALPAGPCLVSFTNAHAYSQSWQRAGVSVFAAAKMVISRDTTRNITLPRAYRIDGTVADSAGRPLTGVLYIQKAGADPRKDGQATAQQVVSGTLIAYLPAGQYDMVFVPTMGRTYAGSATKTSFTLTMPASSQKVSLSAADGVAVSGRVNDAAGRRVRGVFIELRPSSTGDDVGSKIPLVAVSDSSGQYRVSVPTGTYRVVALPPAAGGSRVLSEIFAPQMSIAPTTSAR